MYRWFVLVFSFVFALVAVPADAQVSFGPQVAWGDDTDFGVGGRIHFDLAGPLAIEDGAFQNLFGSATGSYFFDDCGEGVTSPVDCSFIEFNGNAAVPVTIEDSSVSVFFGAGLHLARFSVDTNNEDETPGLFLPTSDTEVGLNLLGGFVFPISDLTGFVEGKFGLVGAEQFILSAGILFGG